MAFDEEQPTEILQQDGVVQRSVITDWSQNENSAGIQIPKELEASPCIVISFAADSEIYVLCQDDYQSLTEDDINDVPDTEHHAGSETETKSKSEREEQMPVPQNHEANTSRTKHQNIPESENIPGTAVTRYKASSWFNEHSMSWMSWFIVFICLSNSKFFQF